MWNEYLIGIIIGTVEGCKTDTVMSTSIIVKVKG